MIDVSALSKKVKELVEDLKARVGANPDQAAELDRAYSQAKAKERTGASKTEWREEYFTQVAVGWVLTSLFVRYLEDHGLLAPVLVGEAAVDRQRRYFLEDGRQAESDTDFLLHVFASLDAPGHPAGEIFGPKRNPLYKLRISGDAATELLAFWRATDADTGALVRDLSGVDSRFLGDVYQDLSEDVRKKYALLQTPDFVEEFILDYTLDPAIAEFGLDAVRFIDPTCGSGHFLLGGFRRLFERKRAERPGERVDVLVREALEATHGVDINPFAVAIARFRLAVEAMTLCGYDSFVDMPSMPLKVACGDSLLLGRMFDRFERSTSANRRQLTLDRHRLDDALSTEDNDLIFGDDGQGGILTQQYHAVVGNPPYITVKDKAARDAYRNYYASCYRSYALVCPFFERFFDLGTEPDDADGQLLLGGKVDGGEKPGAGYVGMIVANSFMKRQFGKALIQDLLPSMDMTHVVDTSGAYIPGHGTPTVIIFGRNRTPQDDEIRTVLGIRGEPSTPKVPREGKVWTSTLDAIQVPGFQSDFVSSDDSPRELFHSHPWSLQGGGALPCKTLIEKRSGDVVESEVDAIGFGAVTREDDAYIVGEDVLRRAGISTVRPISAGVNIRNWSNDESIVAIWPYRESDFVPEIEQLGERFLWSFRTNLSERSAYGNTQLERGLEWYEYSMFFKERFKGKCLISFAFVSTHNHFVLDRGGKVFNRTAPVIKLPAHATEDDHLSLMAALNSSTACFYMKQIFFNKGYGADSKGARTRKEPDEDFYEFDCTKMKTVPIPDDRPLPLSRELDTLGQRMSELEPSAIRRKVAPTARVLEEAESEQVAVFERMVGLQEELDWRCYASYGLLDDDHAPAVAYDRLDELPQVRLGERAFEIVMARKIEAGDLNTSWFERHGSTPTTEVPDRWPQWYRALVEARIALIDAERFIKLIEQPEYKRRWNRDDWADRAQRAQRDWLCARLETPAYIPQADRADAEAASSPRVVTASQLADVARRDDAFMEVGRALTGDDAFDVDKLVSTLVLEESVPLLPSQRYKTSGLSRRKEWEAVWDLQRAEDAIDARVELPEEHPDHLSAADAKPLKSEEIGDIPKPPNYRSIDFRKSQYWSHRGKLDVPKERFVHLFGCERDPGEVNVMWAGLDHAQQAQALTAFYQDASQNAAWEPEQFALVLAGLLDLLPWVRQWHNDLDESTGLRLGDFLGSSFIEPQARKHELGMDALEEVRIGEGAK